MELSNKLNKTVATIAGYLAFFVPVLFFLSFFSMIGGSELIPGQIVFGLMVLSGAIFWMMDRDDDEKEVWSWILIVIVIAIVVMTYDYFY
jgi:hypothetical protein